MCNKTCGQCFDNQHSNTTMCVDAIWPIWLYMVYDHHGSQTTIFYDDMPMVIAMRARMHVSCVRLLPHMLQCTLPWLLPCMLTCPSVLPCLWTWPCPTCQYMLQCVLPCMLPCPMLIGTHVAMCVAMCLAMCLAMIVAMRRAMCLATCLAIFP